MKTFIQWQGTDVCMDFICNCGYVNHYDGYFAYFIKCKNCNTAFKLGDSVEITEVNDTDGCEPLESEI